LRPSSLALTPSRVRSAFSLRETADPSYFQAPESAMDQQTTTDNTNPFLQGGGEMGALVRAYDWSRTSLGDPATWPQSLLTTVGIVLQSRFPMILWWGADYIQIYNDAYRASLGADGLHPSALGQPGAACWGDRWPGILERINTLRNGGDGTWTEDQAIGINRNGHLEEGYWTSSYSAVRGESGSVAGVLVVCTETTRQVESIHRLQQSDRRFQNLVREATVGIIVLTGDEMLVEVVNEAYGLLIDRTAAELLNRPLFSIIPEAEPAFRPLLEGVRQSGQALYLNEHPYFVDVEGSRKEGFLNLVYQPYKESDGTISGVMVLCHDVTEQVLGRKRAEESESRFRTIVEQAPAAMGLLRGPDHIVESANAELLAIMGTDNSVFGKPMLEALPELAGQSIVDTIRSVYETGTPYRGNEIPIMRLVDGVLEERFFDISYTPFIENDKVTGILQVAVDVTTQARARQTLAESEQQVRSLIESAPFPIGVYVGREMRIQFANQSIINAWGKGPNVIGKRYAEVLPELDNQAIFGQLDDVFTTGIAYHAKYQRVDLYVDGALRPYYFNYSFTPVFDADGRIYGVMNTAADVTDLVLATQRLEESETKLRSVIGSSPAAITLFVGPDFVVESPNQAMIDIMGKGGAIIGKPLREALPELQEEGQPFLQILQDVYTTGTMYQTVGSQVLIRKDGVLTDNYYNFTYTPLFDATGAVYAILDIAIDVTEQVMAKKKAEESDLFARTIIEKSPVAKAVMTGEDLIITTVNEKMLEMMGRDSSILGKPFPDAMPELAGTPLAGHLREVLRTGKTVYQPEEKLDLVRHGKPYVGYFNYTFKALINTAGLYYGVIVTATEVTDLVVSRKKVEEAGITLQSAIELAELATWRLDVQTNIFHYSPRFMDWLGFSENTKDEQGAYNPLPDAYRDSVPAAIAAVLAPGSSGIYENEHPIINRLTGEERIIHAYAQLFYDADGQPEQLRGLAQDVTEQRRIRAELERLVQERTEELQSLNEELSSTNEELGEANDRLTQSNRELEEFGYAASHDMQEPLRKIQTFSSFMRDSYATQLDERGRELLSKIGASVARMKTIIDDLLNYSQQTREHRAPEPTDLNVIVRNVEADLEHVMERTGALVEQDTLPVIRAVPSQMNQLFYNLISNALKFTRPGVPPRITIRISPLTPEDRKLVGSADEEGFVKIVFADNGIGFQQEYASQIFGLFKRLHAKTEYEGTGIGLGLVKKIVQSHNGAIYARSALGEGAAFHIILPVE
jgi:PAS domain S-box-containing protein